MTSPLRLGTMTPWGEVGAVGMVEGERYYWFVRDGGVAMIPSTTVEGKAAAAAAMAIVVNLAWLVVRARRELRRVRKRLLQGEYQREVGRLEGAAVEAWNSLQAAKAIFFASH